MPAGSSKFLQVVRFKRNLTTYDAPNIKPLCENYKEVGFNLIYERNQKALGLYEDTLSCTGRHDSHARSVQSEAGQPPLRKSLEGSGHKVKVMPRQPKLSDDSTKAREERDAPRPGIGLPTQQL